MHALILSAVLAVTQGAGLHEYHILLCMPLMTKYCLWFVPLRFPKRAPIRMLFQGYSWRYAWSIVLWGFPSTTTTYQRFFSLILIFTLSHNLDYTIARLRLNSYPCLFSSFSCCITIPDGLLTAHWVTCIRDIIYISFCLCLYYLSSNLSGDYSTIILASWRAWYTHLTLKRA